MGRGVFVLERSARVADFCEPEKDLVKPPFLLHTPRSHPSSLAPLIRCSLIVPKKKCNFVGLAATFFEH